MSRSLYTVLNVAPDADPAVIEAAYKALMKKYHPDVVVEEPDAARRRAAEITEAFHVLKDPGRRAQYDAAERARQESIRRSVVAVAQKPYHPPPPPRRRRSKWPALFVIAAVIIAVIVIWRGSDAAQGDGGAFSFFSQAAEENIRSDALAPVRSSDIDRAVATFLKIRNRSGLLGLSAFSQDCFAAGSTSEHEFDYCVAFDQLAASYDAALPGHSYLPQLPRFQPREVSARHSAAGRLISNDEGAVQARLVQLAALTSERIARLSGTPVVAAPVAQAAPRIARPAASHQRHVRSTRAARVHRAPHRKKAGDPDFLESRGYIY